MPRSTPWTMLAAFLLLGSGLLIAQEQHTNQESLQKVSSASTFTQGYLSGYELGFHHGDLDLQLAHPPVDVKSIRDFRDGKKHYKTTFGDRRIFLKGYDYGFRVGYADAIDGREFDAITTLRALTQNLPEVDPTRLPIMDEALTKGYLDGVHSGLHDGRSTSADYRPDGSDCELALRFQAPPANFYCNVYSLGYRMGYSDGFRNQRAVPGPRRMASSE